MQINVKKFGRIPDSGGWRLNCRAAQPGRLRGLGYDDVHAAIDD